MPKGLVRPGMASAVHLVRTTLHFNENAMMSRLGDENTMNPPHLPIRMQNAKTFLRIRGIVGLLVSEKRAYTLLYPTGR